MQRPQDPNHPQHSQGPRHDTDSIQAVNSAGPGSEAAVRVDTAPANGIAATDAGNLKGPSPMFCTSCGTKNSVDANFCKQCGRRLEKTDRLKISEEAFAQAGSPDEQVQAHLIQAYSRYETGDLEGAIESCARAIEVQPDSTDAHSLLSTLYEKRGERQKAIAERETVLQLNPGSIADRDKLEHLRDEALVLTPRKITSSRASSSSLLDSRAGAAIVAVTVTLFVLTAGLAAVLFGRPHAPSIQAQSPTNPGITLPNGPGMNQASAAPQNTWSAPPSGAPNIPAQNQFQFQQHNPADQSAPSRPSGRAIPDDEPARPISPATVRMPAGNPGGFGNSASQDNFTANQDIASNRSSAGNTIHLPDNGLSPSEIGPPPTGTRPATEQPRNRGKIEITVTNDANAGRQTANQGAGGQPSGEPVSSMDSRSARRIAQDYQLRGQYKLAATNYIKALDGAGEEAAGIHYQIGLCYQRLDDRDSAIAQYNAAIAAYREQLSSGRNTDAANRGIRAAEAGIRACQ